MPPAVSVIIPTKNRPDLLRRCLRAVLEQQTEAEFEVIVVNDGGCAVDGVGDGEARVKLVEGHGGGPAAARNAGIARSAGDIVLFTDDDVIPGSGWIQAAVATLDSFPDALGVVGHVESPPFDPLYEHSVAGDGLGNFLTCNVAYRRQALEKLEGFDTGFPYPAGEDRDLGYRMQEIGELRYEPEMVVVHPPRQIGVLDVARQGRFVESEWRLHHRHPQTRPPRWSVRWGPIIRMARYWQRLVMDETVVRGSPTRAARLVVLAVAQLLVALVVTARGLPSTPQPYPTVTFERRRLRLAWIGPEPQRGGGVAGCAWLLLRELSRRECDIDYYACGSHDELREAMASIPRVRLVNVDAGWRYDRWYSSNGLSKLITGMGCRAWERRGLSGLLRAQHDLERYDAIYQFSTIEVFGMRRHLADLPFLVLHPETHMAGELRWVRRERHLAAQCEPWWRRAFVECFLATRSARQRRDIRLASRVPVISRQFGEQLARDYGVDPERLTLIRNPIDLDELRPIPRLQRTGPWRIAFVSRISARKGVELIVELSHRLADLEGDVTIDIVGGHTFWSDYRPLLADLNSRIASYRGEMTRQEVLALLGDADVLLQPAKYEPFGLTVAEALAVGVPVVASDAVGAAEDVSAACCTIVPAGDVDALEEGVRSMLERLRRGEGPEIGRTARAEAERLFASGAVATCALEMLAAATRSSGAQSGARPVSLAKRS